MHTAETAWETNEFLWKNYVSLGQVVDLDMMPPEVFDQHLERNSPVRPFRIGAWLARQGYFVAAWALWEYYSRSLCAGYAVQIRKAGNESHVNWVNRSTRANGVAFSDHQWFSNANCLRNLIAHYGARAVGNRAENLFDRSRLAFADMVKSKDGYVGVTHSHVVDLKMKIDSFIRQTA
jgi:hypothetical protein